MKGMRTGLYVIMDNLAKDIVSGHIALHIHETTAIRMFSEIADIPNNAVARHPEDHSLVRLGYLIDEDGRGPTILDDYQEIMTAATLMTIKAAAQNQREANHG